MKLVLSTFIFISLISGTAFTQNPLLKSWDHRYGGTDVDWLMSFKQTSDGGYILGGYSESGISGNKTQPSQGGRDYYIVKLDATGNFDWDKVYGGTDEDILYCIEQTADGGYIAAGLSWSGISGNKSTTNWGYTDYWILKLDSAGNKQWEKDFGGLDYDYLTAVKQTPDGGYILSGYSLSNTGGDKTQPSFGGADFWLIKTDASGNKLWDQVYGGMQIDYCKTIALTSENGFMIGGSTTSSVSGNKTSANWDPFLPVTYDYWLVKTDSLGNMLWDKDFGGIDEDILFDVVQTSDNKYLIGGTSQSIPSGNKTQPLWGALGSRDWWVVKIDSSGSIIWDKDFGGNSTEDEFGNTFETQDGGYLFTGTSYSFQSGNKTESNMGTEQVWALKTDTAGIAIWDKTIFTMGHDEQGYGVQGADGCFTFATYTWSNAGGYKSENAWDSVGLTQDYWIIKFCDSTIFNVAAAAVAPDLCPGGCTDFLNLSVNATSFQWYFPGAVPSISTDINPVNICYNNPGTYDVQLIATGPSGSDTLLLTDYILVYPHPAPQSITQSGDTLFAIAGAVSYQWFLNNNTISGATDYFYVATQSGNYNVVATDSNECEVEAVINNVIAGLTPALSREGVTVFPNPVTGTLFVDSYSLIGTAVQISIYNVLGEKIYSENYSSGNSHEPLIVNCEFLPEGIYSLEIISGKKIYRTKFLKQ